MKNFKHYVKVAQERISKDGGDFEKIIDIAKGMIFAGVEPARIYAYCKTGQPYKVRATQEWHDAIHEFYVIVKGH